MIRFSLRLCHFSLFILIVIPNLLEVSAEDEIIDDFENDWDTLGTPIFQEPEERKAFLSRYARQADEGICPGAPSDLIDNTPVTTDRDWAEEVNDVSNVYRRDHGAQDLIMSDYLCKTSQAWANTLAELDMDQIRRSGWKCGENVWAFKENSSDIPIDVSTIEADHPINDMYNENVDYDFEKGGPKTEDDVTTHFSQLVWKRSKWHCTSIAERNDGLFIVTVSHYWPAGNEEGKFKENVSPADQNLETRIFDDDADIPDIDPKNKTIHPCLKVPHGWTKIKFPNETWLKEANDAVNSLRRKHKLENNITEPTILSRKLCKSAQMWANLVAGEHEKGHSPWGCGENMLGGGAPAHDIDFGKWDPYKVEEALYSEIAMYDFRKRQPKPGFSFMNIAHFSAIVWRETKWHCSAIAHSPKHKKFVVVSHFFPPGNCLLCGVLKDNILPPSGCKSLFLTGPWQTIMMFGTMFLGMINS